MPDDLPPIGEDEQYVYSLPGRKDDKQLYRLMLANAEAEGGGKVAEFGRCEEPHPVLSLHPPSLGGILFIPLFPKPHPLRPAGTDPAAAAPAASGKAAPPPAKKGAAPAAADAAPPRPFSPLAWSLPAGNFDLAALGWSNEAGSGLPVVQPAAAALPVPPGVGDRQWYIWGCW